MNTEKARKAVINLLPYIGLAVLMVILNLIVDKSTMTLTMKQIQYYAFGVVLILFTVGVVLAIFSKLNAKTAVFLLICAGVVMRVSYVLYTDLDTRQYDVGFAYTNHTGDYPWSNWKGHMEYIYTLASTGKLPVIKDLAQSYQYYHPPFWHFIASLWMKMNMNSGFSVLRSAQNIQFLTCFFSCSIMVVVYRILKAFDIEDSRSFRCNRRRGLPQPPGIRT